MLGSKISTLTLSIRVQNVAIPTRVTVHNQLDKRQGSLLLRSMQRRTDPRHYKDAPKLLAEVESGVVPSVGQTPPEQRE